MPKFTPDGKRIIKVSYSSLKKYRECSLQWSLVYGPNKVKIRENLRDRAKGILAHAVLNRWVKHHQETGEWERGWMEQEVTTMWQRFIRRAYIRWRRNDRPAHMLEQLLEGVSFLEDCWFEAGFDETPVRSEVRISSLVLPQDRLPHLEIRLNGKIDLDCQIEGVGPVIGDLKFTKNPKFKDSEQLWFYAFLKELAGQGQVRKVFTLVPYFDQPLEIETVPDGHAEMVTKMILDFVESVEEKRFVPEGSATACYFCEYKDHCPRYTPEGTGDRIIEVGGSDESFIAYLEDLIATPAGT